MKNQKNKELTTVQLAYFFEQMAMFIKNGISTWESLYILSQNAQNEFDKELILTLYKDVAGGMFFSQALEKSGKFPEYVIGMIEVAEQTGRVEEVSNALSNYYKSKDVLSQSIRSAVFYPMLMASMVFVVIFVILVEVMPIFEQVFLQIGLALNPISSLLLNIGKSLNQYAAIAIVILLVFVGIYLLMSITKKGKEKLKDMYDKFFLTKNLSNSENANKLSFSLSLMLLSGVDVVSSLRFSQKLIDSKEMIKKVDNIIKSLEKGEALANAIINSNVFKPEYNAMIAASEKSGAESEMLMLISQKYLQETQNNTQRLLGIIEPSLVAFLCITVGVVMLSVMLPLTGILTGM